MTDPVNHPAHYTYAGLECIDIIEALELNYHLGSALAYIWRADRKANPVEDLRKAIWYLERDIKRRLSVEDSRAPLPQVPRPNLDVPMEHSAHGVPRNPSPYRGTSA